MQEYLTWDDDCEIIGGYELDDNYNPSNLYQVIKKDGKYSVVHMETYKIFFPCIYSMVTFVASHYVVLKGEDGIELFDLESSKFITEKPYKDSLLYHNSWDYNFDQAIGTYVLFMDSSNDEEYLVPFQVETGKLLDPYPSPGPITELCQDGEFLLHNHSDNNDWTVYSISSGKLLLPLVDQIDVYSEGKLMAYHINNNLVYGWGIIDSNGKHIFEPDGDKWRSFGKFGVITGNISRIFYGDKLINHSSHFMEPYYNQIYYLNGEVCDGVILYGLSNLILSIYHRGSIKTEEYIILSKNIGITKYDSNGIFGKKDDINSNIDYNDLFKELSDDDNPKEETNEFVWDFDDEDNSSEEILDFEEEDDEWWAPYKAGSNSSDSFNSLIFESSFILKKKDKTYLMVVDSHCHISKGFDEIKPLFNNIYLIKKNGAYALAKVGLYYHGQVYYERTLETKLMTPYCYTNVEELSDLSVSKYKVYRVNHCGRVGIIHVSTENPEVSYIIPCEFDDIAASTGGDYLVKKMGRTARFNRFGEMLRDFELADNLRG